MTCCVGMGRFIALGATGPKIKGRSTLIKTNNAPIMWLFLIENVLDFLILKILKTLFEGLYLKMSKICRY